MNQYAIVAIAGVLSGCMSTTAPTPNVQTPAISKPLMASTEARKHILASRAELWKDPYSIREAKIGEPYACVGGGLPSTGNPRDIPASCVCIELNARNAFGGYTGIQRSIIIFPDKGGIVGIPGNIRFDPYCQGLKPFPELNGR